MEASMVDLFLLSEAQIARISSYFPLSHGVPRVDDRRVVSGIVYVIKHGLQWKDAPREYGPPKTLYNRFIRWSRLGVPSRHPENGGSPALVQRTQHRAADAADQRTADLYLCRRSQRNRCDRRLRVDDCRPLQSPLQIALDGIA
jgi:transposase